VSVAVSLAPDLSGDVRRDGRDDGARLRLHRAAGFLANSSMPIAQTAERSGYSSLQSFSRTFRSVFGVPPAQYRRQGTHSRFRPALSGDDQMASVREVEIRFVGPMGILSVDHVGPYMQIGKAFDALFGWLAKHDLLEAQMRMVGVYFDDPGVVEEQGLRSKAGVLLPGPLMAEVAGCGCCDGRGGFCDAYTWW
jgi:AraC family transcriptional regulator